VAEASSSHIQQSPESSPEERAQSDWLQGYGYQMWRCRHHAFRADGAFGQYIVMMPDQDAVLAITSQTGNMQGVLDLVWEHLLPAMRDSPLPANPSGIQAMHHRIEKLALPVPAENASRKRERNVTGKSFVLDTNERQVSRIAFEFDQDESAVQLTDDRGTYTIPVGSGEWAFSETERRGPYLVARAKNSLTGLPPFKVAGAYRWLDDGALEITLRYLQSPHTETLVCRFSREQIEIDVETGARPAFKIEGRLVRRGKA
jgi:hypothetical protein